VNSPAKKLLQTYERTNGGINGFAVAAKNQAGEEVILVAASIETVARSAKFAGLHEVDLDRIQSVAVLPRCSVLDEVKGD
jgi:hypothetical protein